MKSEKQYKRLRIWGVALFLALGAFSTSVILANDSFATEAEYIPTEVSDSSASSSDDVSSIDANNLIASNFSKSSSSKKSNTNSSKNSSKNSSSSQQNSNSDDAESTYADPQGVKKSLNDSMDTMQDASSKFSTALTVLVIALIAVPVLGLILMIIRQALKTH